jgi:adenylate cyclase
MPHALIVDDEPDAVAWMSEVVQAEGYTVATADSLRHARAQLVRQTPDVLLTDLKLPDGLGTDLVRDLDAPAQVEVVVITGHASVDSAIEAVRIGATDYLTKPVERARLMQLVRKYVPQDQRRRALVVEDDSATREMLRRMLERDGWTVSEAANGRAGLERVAAAPPDLVLLDLMMPELDGFGFVERLRAQPAWQAIPVLVVTAKDPTDEERRRLNGKVQCVIQKGAYTRDALLTEVRRLVQASIARAGEQPTGGE